MKKIIPVLIAFVLVYSCYNSLTSSNSKTTQVNSKPKECNSYREIGTLLRYKASGYFKNPKSYEYEDIISVVENDGITNVVWSAYAQNGFGATQLKMYTASFKNVGKCTFTMFNFNNF